MHAQEVSQGPEKRFLQLLLGSGKLTGKGVESKDQLGTY